MFFRRLADWLALADYDKAKRGASVQVVRRYSRGNVAIQRGSFIEEADLACMSGKAIESMARMQKALSRS